MSTEQRNIKTDKIQDRKKFESFLEELSWLLSSYYNLDFKALSEYINQRRPTPLPQVQSTMGNYLSMVDPNKRFLVGVLPQLFMDRGLFPANDDIAQFANTVMKIDTPHYEKKSRFELIGTIVCRTYQLNDTELQELVKALTTLLSDKENARAIITRKRNLFGWNTIIQELAGDSQNADNRPK